MLRLAQRERTDAHPLFQAIACFEYVVYAWYHAPALSLKMKQAYLAAAVAAQQYNLSSCSSEQPPNLQTCGLQSPLLRPDFAAV